MAWQAMIPTAGLIWILAWNLLSFILMGVDKWRAICGMWRVRERTLFLTALLGGSLGALLGMKLFHHKTQTPFFQFGIPILLVIQIVLTLGVFCWRTFVH